MQLKAPYVCIWLIFPTWILSLSISRLPLCFLPPSPPPCPCTPSSGSRASGSREGKRNSGSRAAGGLVVLRGNITPFYFIFFCHRLAFSGQRNPPQFLAEKMQWHHPITRTTFPRLPLCCCCCCCIFPCQSWRQGEGKRGRLQLLPTLLAVPTQLLQERQEIGISGLSLLRLTAEYQKRKVPILKCEQLLGCGL